MLNIGFRQGSSKICLGQMLAFVVLVLYRLDTCNAFLI